MNTFRLESTSKIGLSGFSMRAVFGVPDTQHGRRRKGRKEERKKERKREKERKEEKESRLESVEKKIRRKARNKPDRATMRPDCVSVCIVHVTYMERQMDEQTGETTE